MAKEVRRRRQHSPPLAGYNSHLLTVPLQSDPPRLPPFIIGGVDDVKDVSILETQSLAWEAAVFALVIVKHGSVKANKDMKAGDYISLGTLTSEQLITSYVTGNLFQGERSYSEENSFHCEVSLYRSLFLSFSCKRK